MPKPSIRRNIIRKTNSIVAYSRALITWLIPYTSPTAQLAFGTRIPISALPFKIDGSAWVIYKIVRAKLVSRQAKRNWFFEETFLWADISIEVILGILFPSPIWIWVCREFIWRAYIMQSRSLLVTIQRVEFNENRSLKPWYRIKAFSSITFPSFEKICLGFDGSQVSTL